MELKGRVFCRSERENLWKAIFEPQAWETAIPDAESYEEVDDNEYEMTVKTDIGPIKGSQTVKLVFSDLDEPHSCKVTLENRLAKSVNALYWLDLPDAEPAEEFLGDDEADETATDEVMPEETRTVFRYRIEADLGNPMFNAILDGFKSRVNAGFAEILGRLDNYANGATETTD